MIQKLQNLGLFVLAWTVWHELCCRLIPSPPLVKKMPEETKKEKQLKRSKHYYYASCFISFLHGPVVLVIGLYIWAKYGYELGEVTEGTQYDLPIYISCSYFIMDGIMGVVKNYESTMVTIHHLVCTVSQLVALLTNMDKGLIAWTIAIGESSNPLLSIMEIVVYNEYGKDLEDSIQLLFGILFILIRVPFVIFTALPVLRGPSMLLQKILCALVTFLSCEWCWAILNKMFKKFSEWFPKSKFFVKGYDTLKKARKFKFVYSGSAVMMIVYNMLIG